MDIFIKTLFHFFFFKMFHIPELEMLSIRCCDFHVHQFAMDVNCIYCPAHIDVILLILLIHWLS